MRGEKITAAKRKHTRPKNTTMLFRIYCPFGRVGKKMKGHKVADGKDGISSPNPELCQRQRLAIYQPASLLVVRSHPEIWDTTTL